MTDRSFSEWIKGKIERLKEKGSKAPAHPFAAVEYRINDGSWKKFERGEK